MSSTVGFLFLALACLVVCVIYLIIGNKYKKKCTERANCTISKIEHRMMDRKREYIPIYFYKINGKEYYYQGSPTNSKNKFHVGDETYLLYNPENPSQCLVEGKNSYFGATLIFAIMAALFIVFFLFIK